jgi:hypothetical protein
MRSHVLLNTETRKQTLTNIQPYIYHMLYTDEQDFMMPSYVHVFKRITEMEDQLTNVAK